MRGPFQEPDPRANLFRIPGNRRTLFGSAAAIGGAFIKSLLPRTSTRSIKFTKPSAYKLGKYAAQAIIPFRPKKTPPQIPIRQARAARRNFQRPGKKSNFRSIYRRKYDTRRRYRSRTYPFLSVDASRSKYNRFRVRRKRYKPKRHFTKRKRLFTKRKLR